jgi:hypothetical protein
MFDGFDWAHHTVRDSFRPMRYKILIDRRNPFQSMRYNNLISQKGFLLANEALIPNQLEGIPSG